MDGFYFVISFGLCYNNVIHCDWISGPLLGRRGRGTPGGPRVVSTVVAVRKYFIKVRNLSLIYIN